MAKINVFPLVEKYINNAKVGEIVVDLKSGHLTVKTDDNTFVSVTRTSEAHLDGLLKLKDVLFREYMAITTELDDIIMKLKFGKSSYEQIKGSLVEVSAKLLFISQTCESLTTQYTNRYEEYNKYLFINMDTFRLAVADNTKKIVAIDFIIDEMKELEIHINKLTENNKMNMDLIKQGLIDEGGTTK